MDSWFPSADCYWALYTSGSASFGEVAVARTHCMRSKGVCVSLTSASAIVRPIAPVAEQIGIHETVHDALIQKTMGVSLASFHGSCESKVERVPTSVIIEHLLASAPSGYVTLEWLFANLRQRSFGLVILILGLMAILPGVCTLAGVVLLILSVQMLMGREVPVLPRFMVSRPLPQARFVLLAKRVTPPIRSLERFISPRWQTPLEVTRRGVGLGLLLMAMTLFVPIPFSNVVPGILIMLVALAYLEDDGLFLTLALAASLISFFAMLAAVWGAMQGAFFLSHI